jgi:tricorn protease-like protein
MKNLDSMKYFIFPLVLFSFIVPSFGQSQTQSQPAAPPSTDIYLFPFENGKILTSDFRNITQRKGYDNQPHFLPDSKSLFYTSIGNDEQADIFLYEIGNATSRQITSTAESEYSPTLMPGGQFFSTVRVEKDGTQRLWKFPFSGGDPVLILEQVRPVGYHAWIDPDSLALFVLGEPATLQIANVTSGNAIVIASNIGRSLHKIPGKTAISYVQNRTEQTGTIKEYDPKSKQTRDLIPLPSGTEDYTWTSDGSLITSNGSKILRWNPSKDQDWVEIVDLASAGLNKITRIAISPDSKWIAFVAEER